MRQERVESQAFVYPADAAKCQILLAEPGYTGTELTAASLSPLSCCSIRLPAPAPLFCGTIFLPVDEKPGANERTNATKSAPLFRQLFP